MNYLTIIQFLGFYVISSFGVYYFLLTYDVEDVTLLDIFIILISFLYYPLIIIYNMIGILKLRYKQFKYKRQVKAGIKKLEKLFNEENKSE